MTFSPVYVSIWVSVGETGVSVDEAQSDQLHDYARITHVMQAHYTLPDGPFYLKSHDRNYYVHARGGRGREGVELLFEAPIKQSRLQFVAEYEKGRDVFTLKHKESGLYICRGHGGNLNNGYKPVLRKRGEVLAYNRGRGGIVYRDGYERRLIFSAIKGTSKGHRGGFFLTTYKLFSRSDFYVHPQGGHAKPNACLVLDGPNHESRILLDAVPVSKL